MELFESVEINFPPSRRGRTSRREPGAGGATRASFPAMNDTSAALGEVHHLFHLVRDSVEHTQKPPNMDEEDKKERRRRRKEKSCIEEWRGAVLPPGASAWEGSQQECSAQGPAWPPHRAQGTAPVHSHIGQSSPPPALGYPAGSCGPVPDPRTLPAQEGRTQQR